MPLFPCSCKENEAVQGVGAFSGGSQLWSYTTELQPVQHAVLQWTGPLIQDTSVVLIKSTATTQGNTVFFKTGDSVWLNVDLNCWIRMNCRNELFGHPFECIFHHPLKLVCRCYLFQLLLPLLMWQQCLEAMPVWTLSFPRVLTNTNWQYYLMVEQIIMYSWNLLKPH